MKYGIWCVQDGRFCVTGTIEEMLRELPRWVTGEAANVDHHRFDYEVREVAEFNWLRSGPIVPVDIKSILVEEIKRLRSQIPGPT